MQEIKKVAENIRDLRIERNEHKKKFEETFLELEKLNKEIENNQKKFSQLEIAMDLTIPSAKQRDETTKKSKFFDVAENEHRHLLIKKKEQQA